MTVANCPSCGAPIEFAIGSSAVVVCNFCHSIVARSDRGLETHGKVAALIDTGSPLRVGVTGEYKGNGFRITGRTQMQHQAGGVWDEWYAAFDDGRWGWLAEAQGRFYVTFQVAAKAPPRNELVLGAAVPALGNLVVAEIGEATLISAEGELPWTPNAGAQYEYADLTGEAERFATIDYSEAAPIVFQGKETTLAELGVSGEAARAPRVAVTRLNCSKCGGALELRAPDQAERIWCPYCGAGHDVTAGKLQYFAMLKAKRVEPVIALGSSGTIDGDVYVIAGFMQRAVKFDIEYYWTEYLLYDREKGYRWLVHSDDHWSFVTPLRPGDFADVPAHDYARTLRYQGQTYKIFQQAQARVKYVVGEFYWRVAVGETVNTADYIAPPYGISKEVTTTGAAEVAYSHARYMTPAEVSKAFQVANLPRPSTIGPMQPFPGGNFAKTWLVLMALLLITAIGLAVVLPGRVVLDQNIDVELAPQTDGAPEGTRVIFSNPFTLTGKNNVEIRGQAPLNNSWLYVAGDLVEESTNSFESFELPLEYYHGVDGGESWSEGRSSRRVVLGRPDKAGQYTLALALQWEPGKTPAPLRVKVREGVFRFPYFLLAFLAITLPAFAGMLRYFSWESQRWSDSAFSPYGQWSTDGEGDDEEE